MSRNGHNGRQCYATSTGVNTIMIDFSLNDYRQCATCKRWMDFAFPDINDGVFQEHRINGVWIAFCSDTGYASNKVTQTITE